MARPEGVIQYGYDARGQLASANWLSRTVSYAYDAQGRLKEADAPEGQWRYSYGAGGQKTRGENLKTGELAQYAYDPLGHLLSVNHSDKSGKTIFKIEYARAGVLGLGPDGQRLGAYETRQNPDGSTETARWAYAYDRLSRLVHEQRWTKINNGQETEDREVIYTYDAAGNRLTAFGSADAAQNESYTYLAGSQKIQEVSYGDGTKCAYEWTANGELSKKIHQNAAGQESSREEYAWGLDGTMTEVAFKGGTNDGITVDYAYDDEGNLIERQVTDKTGKKLEDKKFLVDTQNLTGYSQVLAEIDVLANGRIKYNTFTDELAAQSEAVSASQSATSYPHADGLGSVRALTGTGALGQNLSEKYDYTAFGKPLRGDRSLTSYAFTGQVADAKTGMQYHRARWYDAKPGTFGSIDPWQGDYANPLTLNKYMYVQGNPINGIDPSGFGTESLVSGNKIHRDLELRFKYAHQPNNVLLEKCIWDQYEFADPSDGTKYTVPLIIRPDILDCTNSEVYDVKPYSPYGIATGWDQLLGYVAVLNHKSFFGKSDWHFGLSNIPEPGIYSVNNEGQVNYMLLGNYSGVLFYHHLDLQPVPVPEKVLEDFKNKVREWMRMLQQTLSQELIPVVAQMILCLWSTLAIQLMVASLVTIGIAYSVIRLDLQVGLAGLIGII